MDSKDERVAAVAAENVIERSWGKVREVDPNAQIDPEAAERRQKMRAEVVRMLEALAKLEPLVPVETQ